MLDDGLPRFGQLAVAAGFTCEVDDDAAGLHTLARSGGDQARCRTSRHQCGGDDDVETLDRVFERLLLLGTLVVSEFTGVSALTRGVDSQVEPLSADRTDLLGHLGSHVVTGGPAAEALGGCQRLQTRDTHAEYQHGRGLDGAGRGREHREESRRLVGRHDDRLVAAHVGLRAQRVHDLRARDTRNRLDGVCLYACFLQRADLGVGIARRQEADQLLTAPQLGDLGIARRRHTKHHIRRVRIADRCSCLDVRVVGDQRLHTGTRFDGYRHSLTYQRRNDLRDERHATLTLGRFAHDSHTHIVCFFSVFFGTGLGQYSILFGYERTAIRGFSPPVTTCGASSGRVRQ